MEGKFSNGIQISWASMGSGVPENPMGPSDVMDPVEDGEVSSPSKINKAHEPDRGCVRGPAGVFNYPSKNFLGPAVVLSPNAPSASGKVRSYVGAVKGSSPTREGWRVAMWKL